VSRDVPASSTPQDGIGLLDVLPLAVAGRSGGDACDVAFPPQLARDWHVALSAGADTGTLLSRAPAPSPFAEVAES
jgi:hypothetical protein